MATDTLTDVFEEHRPVLTGVAYRMLGRAVDAEDVVQEAWLRWSARGSDGGAAAPEVREPRAYLVRITARLAIDRLRQIRSRRESYVGPWLPEPIATDFAATSADAAERTILAESVSFAVLVVLESLSPLERAVFVLREAFGFPYGEIAATLDRSEAAVRQLAVRARRRVDERKPRYRANPEECRDLTERFLAAASGGDLEDLLGLLAPQVRLVGDSGGKSKAPLRIMVGADKVSRFLLAVGQTPVPAADYQLTEINGAPGIVLRSAGKPDTVVQLEIANGLVQCIYIVRNPDKFAAIASL